MEPFDPSEARDHLQMVERILAESSQRLCFGAEYFIVWGVYSGAATLLYQLVSNHLIAPMWLLLQLVLLVGALAFSILRGRQMAGAQPRRSLVQREFFNVLWLSVVLAFIVNVAGFNLFSGWGQAAIWSFAETIVLGFIAVHGNRRALVAGILVLASIVAANFVGNSVAGYILAAGLTFGYAGFGVAELLAGE